MKKLVVILVSIAVVFLIILKAFHSKRDIVWRCPAGEEISYIKTSEKPGKLFVVTQKGDSWILRAVYGPDKAEVIASGPGRLPIMNPFIQGHNKNEFLIFAWNAAHKQSFYIHNTVTGIDTKISGAKEWSYYNLEQPFSPDGKWLALGSRSDDISDTYKIWIINRQSGKTSLLTEFKRAHSMDISWTTKGLMIFDRENGNLYRGNEKSLKFFKAIEKYHRNYITPDGDELLMISELPDYGISLILYNLIGNDSRVIYTKYAKLTKQEMAIDTIIIQSIQYSTFSNELTVFANWPPIRPIYVDENRVCKEIPIGRSGRLWYIIHGVAIWKPGVVAYVEDNGKGKRPVTILSMKMK